MGKKLDALLGRNFKTSKFKPLLNLSVSRIAVLKARRQSQFTQARSDVVQFLKLGHHDPALLRVEQVIKEQNMLDVYVMLEGYCLLLIDRISVIEEEKVCPDDLNEVVSSLIFAASRCSGDFPEIQEVRAVLTSRYGKDFAAGAIGLRNNCRVNPKMIQKLSTRPQSLETKQKVLKEIASENGISLPNEENQSGSSPSGNPGSAKLEDGSEVSREETEEEGWSGSMKAKKYGGVAGAAPAAFESAADAAQAAFESAAYAATAARAAVELSRSQSQDPDDPNSPKPQQRKAGDRGKSGKFEGETSWVKKVELGFGKIHPVDNMVIHDESEQEESDRGKKTSASKRSMDSSSSDCDEPGNNAKSSKGMVYDESDDESRIELGNSQMNPNLFKESESERQSSMRINVERRPISVRARLGRGH